MKTQIPYLIEFLHKHNDTVASSPYTCMVELLHEFELYHPSRYTLSQLQQLIKHSKMIDVPTTFEEGIQAFDTLVDTLLPQSLHETKKRIFTTLLQVNFPEKKGFLSHSLELFISQLVPVEKSIYENLLAYVKGINRALALFCLLSLKEQKNFTPERFVAYAEAMHLYFLNVIFNDEEKELVHTGLKELLGVYLSLYGTYLYAE